jgi:hypothetical protein
MQGIVALGLVLCARKPRDLTLCTQSYPVASMQMADDYGQDDAFTTIDTARGCGRSPLPHGPWPMANFPLSTPEAQTMPKMTSSTSGYASHLIARARALIFLRGFVRGDLIGVASEARRLTFCHSYLLWPSELCRLVAV